LSCLALAYLGLSCLALSCPTLSCHVLSFLVLSCLVVTCHVLPCLVFSCLVFSCHVLPYFIFSSLSLTPHALPKTFKNFVWCLIEKARHLCPNILEGCFSRSRFDLSWLVWLDYGRRVYSCPSSTCPCTFKRRCNLEKLLGVKKIKCDTLRPSP
jgi:hypothetical protein